MSATFSAVRVKQEIARLGILPYPEFWAKTTILETPGPALLLHFILVSILISAAPLSSVNGYLVVSTLYTYAKTPVGILLGVAILAAPKLDSFKFAGNQWYPRGSRLGFWALFPMGLIYVLTNLFLFTVIWFPSGLQKQLLTKSPILPSFIGPTVGLSCFVGGALYWIWDRKILKALGYRLEPLAERQEGYEVCVFFNRLITEDSIAESVVQGVLSFIKRIKRSGRVFSSG